MDDINQDRNNLTNATARFILPQVITSTAFNITGSDYAFYADVYMEHHVGVFGQMFNAETRNGEPFLSSTYNNSWAAGYNNLWNLKTVIQKCSEGGPEAGNFQALGVAQVLSAYNLAMLTDLMGDVPWTETGQPGVIYQPKIDKQEAIYADVMKFLDDAIVNLEKPSDFESLGSKDFLFNGDSESWVKMAYGLKARYKMRLSFRSAKYQEVIDDVNQSFTTAAEQAAYKFNGGSTKNPFFLFQQDRKYFGASQSLHNKLVSRNDPRDARFFVPNAGQTEVLFAQNGGTEQVQQKYGISGLLNIAAPVHILSYHELQFLKAEAYARLNNVASAEAALKLAINAAFVKVGLTEAAGTTYYNSNVKALFDANPLQEIMNQKYFACFEDESIEAYNDYRRLKAMNNNVITLANPGKFPLRFTYGSSDVTTNNNVKAAYGDGQYVATENVWWAGGTR